mmetsp:Transcript_24167/g.53584  ORF Transcript_24167/g.53584 Transcript_24167/m.53584 type:complete len:399 (-) Transcript_24167:107-1303(-)
MLVLVLVLVCCLHAASFAVLAATTGPLPVYCFPALALACSPLLLLLMLGSKVLELAGFMRQPARTAHLDWGVDLRGCVCVVTGSNTGIGKQTAASLAELGATVVMACRSRQLAEEAKAELDSKRMSSRSRFASEGSFVVEELDLGRLASVRAFTSRLEKRFGKACHILVNNAGMNGGPATANGYNACFQVNYLGHFYLTVMLLPMMQESARKRGQDSRVVCLSSVCHNFADPSLNLEAAAQSKGNHYCESKLWMLLLAVELQRRKLRGIRALAVNPGAVRSDIWRTTPRILLPFFHLVMRIFFLDTQQGSAPSVAAAVAPVDIVPLEALYLIPYRTYGGFTLPFEIVGPFGGVTMAEPRLPPDVEAVSAALWTSSLRLIKPVIGQDSIALLQCVSGLR